MAERLQNAGADYIVICTNTMHKVVPQIEKKIHIPIIHIADTTEEVLKQNNITKVGLLGTKYTMTQNFYKDRILRNGIQVLVPDEQDIEIVNHIIYDELCQGIISEQSKNRYDRTSLRYDRDTC